MVKPAASPPDAPDTELGAMFVCGLCGRSFTEDRAQPTCQGCPLAGGCHFVRCPHCGYENPVAPAWIGRLRHWLRGGDA